MDIAQNTNINANQEMDLKNDLIPELKIISASESKVSSLTLLIVTIILFFSSQIISAKWQETLILIGVLLFHELGHLAAMKLLKYNDVKMFFIPFFGAAVSGKSRNDTAVKNCIVSLMGPLPGIVLGVLLYFLFGLTKNYYIFKTAQVMLLLNAFNFLPIMPLDGGRFVDVLFVNRRYFRFLFAFAGAAVFIILAGSASDIFIGILGVFSVYVAIGNFKLHGMSNDLKTRGINAASVNGLIEDEPSLQIVIDKLKAAYPKLFKPKVSYRGIFNQLTVIVDTIKFEPARFLPKVVLLASYLVLVIASLVVAIFFIAANYQEIPRTEMIDGKNKVYVEHHLFGRKSHECPVNEALYYDGKGSGFGVVSGAIRDVSYYENGYRTGEWLSFNDAGETIEKKTYAQGQLMTISRLENGVWQTSHYQDLSILRKCSEEIQRISQPFRSNYKYF